MYQIYSDHFLIFKEFQTPSNKNDIRTNNEGSILEESKSIGDYISDFEDVDGVDDCDLDTTTSSFR